MSAFVSKFVFDRACPRRRPTAQDAILPQATFTMSFDCDDDSDPDSFPWLLDLLDRYKMAASFAVCGQVVEENHAAYKSLIERGHEIVNHGYSKHSSRNGKHTISTLFYDRVPVEFIRQEVQKNHDVIASLLGYEMIGFRVPHFGYFQDIEQVTRLFEILESQGYKYDSSLTAFSYLRHRRQLKKFSIVEFPLSPHPRHPRGVLDSWGYFSVGGRKGLNGFVRDFGQLIRWAMKTGRNHHVNVYVDPSHVAYWAGFEECLAMVQSQRGPIQVKNYAALVSPQVEDRPVPS